MQPVKPGKDNTCVTSRYPKCKTRSSLIYWCWYNMAILPSPNNYCVITHPNFSILIMSKLTTSNTFMAWSSPTEQRRAPSALTAMLSITPAEEARTISAYRAIQYMLYLSIRCNANTSIKRKEASILFLLLLLLLLINYK